MKLTINGQPGDRISALDRGLQYGDGVFETMRVRRRHIRLLEFHLDRLYRGMRSLHINGPARRTLRGRIEAPGRTQDEGVLKLIVTRGEGVRGYRPTRSRAAHSNCHTQCRALRRCNCRSARASAHVRHSLRSATRLAGLKTLNRLESVLARSEWRGTRVWEGLMRDTDGRIVCGTMSNLFRPAWKALNHTAAWRLRRGRRHAPLDSAKCAGCIT